MFPKSCWGGWWDESWFGIKTKPELSKLTKLFTQLTKHIFRNKPHHYFFNHQIASKSRLRFQIFFRRKVVFVIKFFFVIVYAKILCFFIKLFLSMFNQSIIVSSSPFAFFPNQFSSDNDDLLQLSWRMPLLCSLIKFSLSFFNYILKSEVSSKLSVCVRCPLIKIH